MINKIFLNCRVYNFADRFYDQLESNFISRYTRDIKIISNDKRVKII